MGRAQDREAAVRRLEATVGAGAVEARPVTPRVTELCRRLLHALSAADGAVEAAALAVQIHHAVPGAPTVQDQAAHRPQEAAKPWTMPEDAGRREGDRNALRGSGFAPWSR